jgi:hypothetical protein
MYIRVSMKIQAILSFYLSHINGCNNDITDGWDLTCAMLKWAKYQVQW